MATVCNLFLGIFSLALCLSVGTSHHTVIKTTDTHSTLDSLREQLMAVAVGELGVRERTGNNDGERVEEYLAYTKLVRGHDWCAAFVCWCYGQVGRPQPRNPWSPALFPKARRYTAREDVAHRVILPADVFGIYGASAKRINHVGLVKAVSGPYIISVEGNSDNRVASKRRPITTIYAFANWLK